MVANAERWKFNEESRCIHEDDWRGLALFEVLVATSDLQARAAAAAPAACHDCGCPEDDHRFGAAYQRLVAEDNGARRDGPNPCLNCLNCGRA